ASVRRARSTNRSLGPLIMSTTSAPSLAQAASPGTDRLAIQAKPRRCWPDAVSGRVLQHRHPSLDLPTVPPADGAIEHGTPFVGLGLSQLSGGPIPKEILQH